MYTAAALAMRYDIDLLEKAQVAGLLHDCAKCIPNDKKIRMCEKYNIPVSETEIAAPSLLHAKLGAVIAEKQYGITDSDILEAIRWHTTGKPEMNLLEEIIYIADYIEPARWKASDLAEVRAEAFSDLTRAVYVTMRDTITYLEGSPGQIDETTRLAYHYYQTRIKPE